MYIIKYIYIYNKVFSTLYTSKVLYIVLYYIFNKVFSTFNNVNFKKASLI